MNPLANLHGKIMPLEEVTISPLDRGFLFGDAVYEVLRVYQGKPWLEDEHFGRFARSLEEIRIRGVDMARMRRRMHETIKAGGFGGGGLPASHARSGAAQAFVPQGCHAAGAPLGPGISPHLR